MLSFLQHSSSEMLPVNCKQSEHDVNKTLVDVKGQRSKLALLFVEVELRMHSSQQLKSDKERSNEFAVDAVRSQKPDWDRHLGISSTAPA